MYLKHFGSLFEAVAAFGPRCYYLVTSDALRGSHRGLIIEPPFERLVKRPAAANCSPL